MNTGPNKPGDRWNPNGIANHWPKLKCNCPTDEGLSPSADTAFISVRPKALCPLFFAHAERLSDRLVGHGASLRIPRDVTRGGTEGTSVTEFSLRALLEASSTKKVTFLQAEKLIRALTRVNLSDLLQRLPDTDLIFSARFSNREASSALPVCLYTFER